MNSSHCPLLQLTKKKKKKRRKRNTKRRREIHCYPNGYYILFGVKHISICESLNPITMQLCILSSFIIIIIFILFIVFSVNIGFFFFFCLHVILINEFKTFENIIKFLKAPSLFLLNLLGFVYWLHFV